MTTTSVRQTNPKQPVSYKHPLTNFYINLVLFYIPAMHNAKKEGET